VKTANEIRQIFIDFFKGQSHAHVDSAPLVPRDDPSLMFTNAGMVQFKKVFLGQEKRDYSRAVTSQKCLRVGGKHNDLENVGRTARHHTFFEMLGNFSFGDYFKEQAIDYAWTLLTRDLALPKEKLHATIFLDDDEAFGLWKKVAGLPEERIFRLGEKDNFWSMGDTGPCGPCSEVLIDQGEHMSCGPDCGIGKCDCDRFLEVWNLVFMQYDQIGPSKRETLPRPSIDTGMGLERIAAVCQGVYSNYDIDLFRSIIDFTADMASQKYKTDPEKDTALRVIADHSRAMAFMVADGILPSNEGRGYVLRRLIRRAFRFGRLLGLRDPFLHGVAGQVVEHMGQAFPEIVENRAFMARVVKEEEERFSQTLDKGLAMLEEEMERMRAANQARVSGDFVFRLYDTYGFPIDIVNDIAEKRGMNVDEAGFTERMAEQKVRAKAAWKGSGEVDLSSRFRVLTEQGLRSEFVGYDCLEATGTILALLDERAEAVERLAKGQQGFVVTDKTPFYGESGGQLGDTGSVRSDTGAARVTDSLKPAPNLTVLQVEVEEGELLPDRELRLGVEQGARLDTARNHTATHLLHAALRTVLGEHVKQSGSLVGPGRLRFDFTHITAMTPDELQAVEREVNRAVLADVPLRTETMSYDQARQRGAMALFGEKYAADVRVVEVPGTSIELCGGTHLQATGQIGFFTMLSESGVAAGVRRIEAATGWNAIELFQKQRSQLAAIAEVFKSQEEDLAGRVKGMQAEIKRLHKELDRLAAKAASSTGGGLMDNLEDVGGVKLLAARVDAPNVKALRELMDDVRSKLPSGVACLATENDGKVPLILYVSKDLHQRFTASGLINDVAAHVGGGGGGRPDLAQAGGTNPQGLERAFEELRGRLRA
jgi:alanyl-tRNA synthetase